MRTTRFGALGMIVESEVRQKLADFLGDRVSLQDFEDWLVSNSWNMHRDSSASAQNLVSDIELLLSEYSSEHRVYDELQNELSRLLDSIVVAVRIANSEVKPARPSSFRANAF